MLTNIEYNNNEINQIVLENTLKMFERRKIISSHLEELNKINEIDPDKNIYELKLLDETICKINIINTKITSISSGSLVDLFLSKNLEDFKILIIRDFTKKIIKDILANYNNVEIFFISEMMEDLPSKIFIPKHIKLESDELNELLSKFTELEFGKIFLTDKMCRYYGGKVGDIFKIIRYSVKSGYNTYYRRVVNSSWDILF